MNTRACLVAVCLIAITAACDTGSATQEPTIVIASDFPTTGAPGNTVPLVHAIQLAIAQHHRAWLLAMPDHLSAAPSARMRGPSRHLLRRELQHRLTVARPAISISSSQAKRHCSIRSNIGKRNCPFFDRNSASLLALAFPFFSIV